MKLKLKKSLKSLPFQVLVIFIAVLAVGAQMPVVLQQASLALSLSLKEVLLFFLPALVFSFLFLALRTMHQGLLVFIFFLLGAVCLSNFVSVMLSYGAGLTLFSLFHLHVEVHRAVEQVLGPLWTFDLPKWISNDGALLAGFIASLVLPRFFPREDKKLARICNRFSHLFLNRFFVPLVPLFILGFIFKLNYDGQLGDIISQYGPLMLVIFCLQFGYILTLYIIAAGGKVARFKTMLRNMVPAFITGFSSMSSAAALPLTLQGTQKNTRNDPVTEAIVPATVNIHMIGDSVGVPLMAMGVMMTFFGHLPSLDLYLHFALAFVMVKFAVAAVPGGGVLVIVPVLEKCFDFTPEMTGLLTAMYILFDSVNSGANVLGNGAFAVLLQKVWHRFYPRAKRG